LQASLRSTVDPDHQRNCYWYDLGAGGLRPDIDLRHHGCREFRPWRAVHAGAYVGVVTLAATGIFWIALVVATLIIAAARRGNLSDDPAPLLGRDPLTTILATLGSLWFCKTMPMAVRSGGAAKSRSRSPATSRSSILSIRGYRLVIALLSAAIIGALWLFLKFGTYGIWIRATTQDRVMAQAMASVPWVLTIVFAIGAAMAAPAACFSAHSWCQPRHGARLDFEGLIVVVIGGMGNLAARSPRRSLSVCWRRTPPLW